MTLILPSDGDIWDSFAVLVSPSQRKVWLSHLQRSCNTVHIVMVLEQLIFFPSFFCLIWTSNHFHYFKFCYRHRCVCNFEVNCYLFLPICPWRLNICFKQHQSNPLLPTYVNTTLASLCPPWFFSPPTSQRPSAQFRWPRCLCKISTIIPIMSVLSPSNVFSCLRCVNLQFITVNVLPTNW